MLTIIFKFWTFTILIMLFYIPINFNIFTVYTGIPPKQIIY